MRRTARTALATALLAATALGACTDDGSTEAFCERVADVPPLGEVLADIDVSDPGGTRRDLDDAADAFRALEADAPGAVKADVARLREGVELVVEAVEENPGDLPAAREAITGQADELSGLAQASRRVVDYADEECGVSLDDGVTVPSTPGAGDGSTTTGG
ncbi:hypothetical protein PO878_08525 [Iamia majanohamensis]|uniref:Secreted protein n=1 Tax=Iamia majanohamensis TaxID=467976 RepID=A0AAF0BX99_9ACTN|nr:hypothetical protein [Iamia majanohamensis]WCO68768.1 hypothetical protein PO878_08525 [Iamia majanohamensis]